MLLFSADQFSYITDNGNLTVVLLKVKEKSNTDMENKNSEDSLCQERGQVFNFHMRRISGISFIFGFPKRFIALPFPL